MQFTYSYKMSLIYIYNNMSLTKKNIFDKEIANIANDYFLNSKELTNDFLLKNGYNCTKWQLADIICSFNHKHYDNMEDKINYLHEYLNSKGIGRFINYSFAPVEGETYNKNFNDGQCNYTVSNDGDIFSGTFNIISLNSGKISFEFFNLDKILKKLDIADSEKIMSYYS